MWQNTSCTLPKNKVCFFLSYQNINIPQINDIQDFDHTFL